MKSILGLSNLGVAPAFPIPYNSENYFAPANVPHDRTLVLDSDIADFKKAEARPSCLSMINPVRNKISHPSVPEEAVFEKQMPMCINKICSKLVKAGSKIR